MFRITITVLLCTLSINNNFVNSSANIQSRKNVIVTRSNQHSICNLQDESATWCPISKKVNIQHTINSCEQVDINTQSNEQNPYPHFKCKCNLSDLIFYNLNESFTENGFLDECKNVKQRFDCIHVYPRMAVTGYNLIFHPWVSKDNCFNLCLQTNVMNGDSFDCKSFEHWHDDCSELTVTTNNPSSSSRENIETNNPCNEYLMHSSSRKEKRQTRKKNLCVLSNQTKETAGELFTSNDAVTYYEITCKKFTYDVKTLKTRKPSRGPPKTTTSTSTSTSTTKSNAVEAVITQKTKDIIFTIKAPCASFPCLNGGVCVTMNKTDYKCECSDDYVGKNCNKDSTIKYCHEKYMEILIAKELLNKLGLNMGDIYVNSIENNFKSENTGCRVKSANEFYVMFDLNYEQCSTMRHSDGSITRFINKLFAVEKDHNEYKREIIDASSRKLLKTFECDLEIKPENQNFDENSSDNVEIISESLKGSTTKKAHKQCFIKMLDIRVRFYLDSDFQNEIIELSDPMPKNLSSITLEYAQLIFIEVSVVYTDRAFNLFKYYELQNSKLTISKFWTSQKVGTKVENNVYINDGCAKPHVRYYEDPISKHRKIRFSIKPKNSNMNKTTITFHTILEICNDEIASSLTKRKSNNLIKLSTCQSIYDTCKRKFDQQDTTLNEEIAETKSLEQMSSDSVENCRLKIKNGPIYIFERRLIDINNERINSNNHATVSANNKSRSNSKEISILINIVLLMASQFLFHYQ